MHLLPNAAVNPLAVLFVLIVAWAGARPGWAESLDALRLAVPASDAELSGVSQAIGGRKETIRPALDSPVARSQDTTPQPVVEAPARHDVLVAPVDLNRPLDDSPPLAQSPAITPQPLIQPSMQPALIIAPEKLNALRSETLPATIAAQAPELTPKNPVALKVVYQAPVPDQPTDVEAAKVLVERWSKDWSEQNVQAYLSHYAPEFQPADAGSRSAWAAQRRTRLTQPKSIALRLQEVAVEAMSSRLMQVRFRQHYRSDRYADTVQKQLTLEKTVDGWKILKETVIP